MATYDKDTDGNILVRNYGTNPAVNYNFMLRVEGVFDLPCKSVQVFQRENEYELIQEGGLNDYVHMRRKPISKPFTFKVERYVGVDFLDPLANGTDLVLPVILIINRGRVYQDDAFVRMYTFTGCTVMAKEYGELNAEKSGLLVETTTIAYREMILVDNIAASWQSSDVVSMKRQGVPSKDEFETKAAQSQWMFYGGDKAMKYGMADKAQADYEKQLADYKKKAAEAKEKKQPEPEPPKVYPNFMGYNGVTKDSSYRSSEMYKQRKKDFNDKAVQNMWMFKGGDMAVKSGVADKAQKDYEKQLADYKKQSAEAEKNHKPAPAPPTPDPDFMGYNGVTKNSAYRTDEMYKQRKKDFNDIAFQNLWMFKGGDVATRYWAAKQAAVAKANGGAVTDLNPPSLEPDFMGYNGVTKNSPYRKNEVRKANMPHREWPKTKSAVDVKEKLAEMNPATEEDAQFLGIQPRVWPKTKSALDLSEWYPDVEPPKPRKWPPDKSAIDLSDRYPDVEPPEPRVWPDTKSALDLSEWYPDVEPPKPRRWPPDKSAVDVAKFLAARK